MGGIARCVGRELESDADRLGAAQLGRNGEEVKTADGAKRNRPTGWAESVDCVSCCASGPSSATACVCWCSKKADDKSTSGKTGESDWALCPAVVVRCVLDLADFLPFPKDGRILNSDFLS